MKYSALILAVFTILAGPLTVAAQQDLEDDLKTTHRLLVEAAKTGNVAFLESVIHPQALGFMRESQIVVDLTGGSRLREIIPSLLVDMSRFLLTPYETAFRAFGNSGIICSTSAAVPQAPDPKTNKKGPARYSRATWLYARLDGRWRLVGWHTSDIPLKSK